MTTLFFDTETNGLPDKNHNWETHYNEFPYIVQIAWIMGDVEEVHIIKPETWHIPDDVVKIHGINETRAICEGESNRNVLTAFLEDAKKSDLLVGHNIYFDISIIKANLLKIGFDKTEISDALHKNKRFCTMQKSRKIFGKWPKLIELHQSLFSIDFEDAHSALGDTRATKRCYEELIKMI